MGGPPQAYPGPYAQGMAGSRPQPQQVPGAPQPYGAQAAYAQATLPAGPVSRETAETPSRDRLGFMLGGLVVVGLAGLAFVLPSIGLVVGFAGLVFLGTRDRIRPYGDTGLGAAVVAALWRAVAAYAVAAAVGWGLEALLELVAGAKISAGHWTTLRDMPTGTVLAVFTALVVLLACGAPRWRSPSRALARMVTGSEGGAPIVRYVLLAGCALAIVAALFAPAPSWWPVPFDPTMTLGDVLL